MKRFVPLVALFIFSFLPGYGQTLEITFTAQNKGQHVELDSILIENITQDCDTILFSPDTVLLLDYSTGLDEVTEEAGGILLYQNYPNPFSNKTSIRLFLAEKQYVHLMVTDITGRKLAEYADKLEAGMHYFNFYPGNARQYLLVVRGDNNGSVIKMINDGGEMNNSCKLTYVNSNDMVHTALKQAAGGGFLFCQGDELRYTGYAQTLSGMDGSDTITDAPETNTDYVFDITVIDPILATITTDSVTAVSSSTAISGGEVLSDGGSPVSLRGVCWSTSPEPTTADERTEDGSGLGTFISELTGLTKNTTYYVRAYATNSVGIAYGNETSFTTLAPTILPTVVTDSVTDVLDTTAICHSEVTDSGSYTVTARGVCWSTLPGITLADSCTIDGSGLGGYTSFLSVLISDTTYYVRAYATSSAGTAYGNELSFTTLDWTPCPGEPTIYYEGLVYNTVYIGTQCWLKENLNVGTRIDGPIDQTDNGVIEKYCYDDIEDNCDIYGGLYQWDEMMQYVKAKSDQGICPAGWHVPTDEEWKQLEGAVDSQYDYPDPVWDYSGWRGFDVGKRLKTVTGWLLNMGTDAYGFSALPGGYRYINGYFNFIGSAAFFWSSTENTNFSAWYRNLYYNNDEAHRYHYNKDYGLSLRCVKD